MSEKRYKACDCCYGLHIIWHVGDYIPNTIYPNMIEKFDAEICPKCNGGFWIEVDKEDENGLSEQD